MNKKLQNIVEKYSSGKISLDETVKRITLYDRQRFKTVTKPLIKELHPTLQDLFWDFIKEVESKTNFIYFGIYNGMEDTDLKHYHVKFQHKYYFSIDFDLCYGSGGSSSSGKDIKYFITNDGKIHMGCCNGSASFVYGEFNVKFKDLQKDLMKQIIHFDESIPVY
jgi:hypothetical protein